MDPMVRRVKFLLTLLLFSFLFVGFSNPTVDLEQKRRDIVETAMDIYNSGAKYVWGATGQNNTYDCSGYTQFVFKKEGINIPRVSKEQSQYTEKISKDQLKPGDLVFFNRKNGIGHVGIYLGDGKVLHSSGGEKNSSLATAGKGPTISNLDSMSGFAWGASLNNILLKNGYTGVNEVAGDSAFSEIIGYNKDFTRNISFDEIARDFQDIIETGINMLMGMLIPFLTVIFLIDCAFFGIVSYLNETANFMKEMILRFLKFTLFIYFIQDSINLIKMTYDMFAEIAKTLSGVEKPSVDGLIDVFIANAKSVLDSLMDFNLTLNAIFNPTGTAIYFLFLLIILIAMAVAYLQLCYEIFSATIIFYLAVGMSFGLFPLKAGKITEKYGTNPISTAFACGLKLIITLIMVGVANGLLDKAVLKAEAVKGMDYMQLLWILGYTLLVCFLVKNINNMFAQFR